MSASTVTTPSPTAGVPLPQSLVSLVPGKHPELESTGLRHPIDDLTAFRLERFISDAKSRCGDPILSAQATLLLHESLARRSKSLHRASSCWQDGNVAVPSAAREPTDISAQLAAMESRLQAHLDLSISALKESVGTLKMSIDDLRREVHLGFDQTRQQTAQARTDVLVLLSPDLTLAAHESHAFAHSGLRRPPRIRSRRQQTQWDTSSHRTPTSGETFAHRFFDHPDILGAKALICPCCASSDRARARSMAPLLRKGG